MFSFFSFFFIKMTQMSCRLQGWFVLCFSEFLLKAGSGNLFTTEKSVLSFNGKMASDSNEIVASQKLIISAARLTVTSWLFVCLPPLSIVFGAFFLSLTTLRARSLAQLANHKGT